MSRTFFEAASYLRLRLLTRPDLSLPSDGQQVVILSSCLRLASPVTEMNVHEGCAVLESWCLSN